MSAYQEGDRVRVIKAEAASGIYENGSTGTVIGESKSGLMVRWDHNDKTGMVFEREIERMYDDEPRDVTAPEHDELTAWDRYAIAALQGLLARENGIRGGHTETAAAIADHMMVLRRGKAS